MAVSKLPKITEVFCLFVLSSQWSLDLLLGVDVGGGWGKKTWGITVCSEPLVQKN